MIVSRINKTKGSNIEKGFSLIILTIVIVSILLTFNSNPFSNRLDAHDSSMFLYFGKGMSEGMVPYKDIFDHKGVVLFFIQYLASIVGFGNIFIGIFVIQAVFLVVAIIYLYKIGILLTKSYTVSSLILLISTGLFAELYEGGNLSEEYALTFITISLFYFIKEIMADSLKNQTYFFLGLMGGLVFFMRMNMISLWAVFCIGIAIREMMTKNYKVLAKKALLIFLGGIFVVAIAFSYSIITNSFSEMIYQTFTLNLEYSSVTFSERISSFRFFFELFSVYGMPLISAFMLAVYFIRSKYLTKSQRTIILSILISLILNFFTIILSGRNYRHYATTGIPFLLAAQFIVVSFYSTKLSKKNNLLALCTVVIFMVPAFVPTVAERINNVVRKDMPIFQQEQLDIADYINKNSSENDVIYVHAIDANIYLHANRFSNSQFFVLPSLNYEEFPDLKNQFIHSMENNPPKFIVISKNSYLSDNPNNTRLNKVVIDKIQSNYIQIGKFDKNYYLFELNL